MRRLWIIALLPWSIATACKGDKCENEAPSFQLDVELSDAIRSEARQLVVELQVGGDRWSKTFELTDKFSDGKTSLGVDVVPAPTDAFEIKVVAKAIDASRQVIAQGDMAQMARPNGCNHLQMTLLKSTPQIDGGPDAGPDLGPEDLGIDLGVDDTGIHPDAGPDAEIDGGEDVPPIDTGDDVGFEDVPDPDVELMDDGVFPDVELPDDGVFPDADPPDLGPPDTGVIIPVAFNYTPSNFTPNIATALEPLIIDCGQVTFDSATFSFSPGVCRPGAPLAVPQQQTNGPTAA